MNDKQLNLEKKRLRAILSYEFSGTRSWESCDIVTREKIQRLVQKILGLKAADPI